MENKRFFKDKSKDMKTINDIMKVLSEYKEEISKKYGVKKIGIFGSYIRGEQSEGSDVDIVVEFKKGYKTFDNYMDLKFYFEKLLNKKVDLIIESAIKPGLKPHILEEVRYA